MNRFQLILPRLLCDRDVIESDGAQTLDKSFHFSEAVNGAVS